MVVAGAVTVVAEDGTAARRRARAEVAMYLAVVGALDATVRLPDGLVSSIAELVATGNDAAAGALIPDEVLDRLALGGPPEALRRTGPRRHRGGRGPRDFGTPHGLTDADGISLLGSRVLPLLRE